MPRIDYAMHLREAKKLISDPKNWTQWALARDDHGDRCSAKANKATRFCAYGACERVGDVHAIIHFLDRAALNLYGRADAVALNDSIRTTHELIMQMFDMAIAEAEASK